MKNKIVFGKLSLVLDVTLHIETNESDENRRIVDNLFPAKEDLEKKLG